MQFREALTGVRVLDFTWYAAGPIATQYLADFGAEVIKVENPKRLDALRVSGPYKGGVVHVNGSGFFLQLNSGKKSITLDTTSPQGRGAVRRLIPLVDVVVENFSPGVMAKMGLSYPELKKIKPDIIMASSSVLGREGAGEDFRGFGPAAMALSGHLYLTGWPDRAPPLPATVALSDCVTPLFTVIAVMAALDFRRRTGRGLCIDLAHLDLMMQFLSPAVLDYIVNQKEQQPMGNRHPQAAPHGVFRCQGEDSWCAVSVFSETQWHSLCLAMSNPLWTQDPKFATLSSRKENEDELNRYVEGWTGNLPAVQVMTALQQVGVPAGAVQNARDMLESDPQLQFRKAFVRLNHPVIGSAYHLTTPIKLSRTPSRPRTAPCLGADNEYVFKEVAGMSDQELADLLNAAQY